MYKLIVSLRLERRYLHYPLVVSYAVGVHSNEFVEMLDCLKSLIPFLGLNVS